MIQEEARFEQMLAIYCAPVLKKYKVANMFHLDHDAFTDIQHLTRLYQQKLNDKGISIKLLQSDLHRMTIFVYQKNRLSLWLKKKEIQQFLADFHYPKEPLSKLFAHLDDRLHHCPSYPHEIGIFLGYPLSDVRSFCQRKPCLFQGYWNVYQYPQAAKRLFQLYDDCTHELLSGLCHGHSIEQLI